MEIDKHINFSRKRKRRGKKRKQQNRFEIIPSNTSFSQDFSFPAIAASSSLDNNINPCSPRPWCPKYFAGTHYIPLSPTPVVTSDIPFCLNNENREQLPLHIQFQTMWKPTGPLLKNEEQYSKDTKILYGYVQANNVGPNDENNIFLDTVARLRNDYIQTLLKERDHFKHSGNLKNLKEITDFIMEKLDYMINLFRLASRTVGISKMQHETLFKSERIFEYFRSQLTDCNPEIINVPSVSPPPEMVIDSPESINIPSASPPREVFIHNPEYNNIPGVSSHHEASPPVLCSGMLDEENGISEKQQEALLSSESVPESVEPSEVFSPAFYPYQEEERNLNKPVIIKEESCISERQQEVLPLSETVSESVESQPINRNVDIPVISPSLEAPSPGLIQELKQELEKARNEVYMLLEQLSGTQTVLEKLKKSKHKNVVELQNLNGKLLDIRANLAEKSQCTENIKKSFTERVRSEDIISDIKGLINDNIQFKDKEKVPISACSSKHLNVTEYEVHLVTMITSFLRTIPYPVTLDFIFTHVERIDNSLTKEYVEKILLKYPSFFREESIGAGSEKGWSYLELKPIITI